MGEVAEWIGANQVDPNLGKLQELARYIASHNVTIDSDTDVASDTRYKIYVDNLAVKGGWWTYDQAWCILVGMRAM